MRISSIIPVCLASLSLAAAGVFAQQGADLNYRPEIPSPSYPPGSGPRIAIDESHHNFHTADGRYRPFAELLRRDGYRVDGFDRAISRDSLAGTDVLVVSNPLHERNVTDWSLPTPSAFTSDEIAALRHWVEEGGALLLILDHMPFPGAGGDLAEAFGFRFSNGFAIRAPSRPAPFVFTRESGLMAHRITRGRSDKEAVERVATFVGSAFQLPPAAESILSLSGDFVSVLPTRAWEFPADVPREPLDGWSQGAVLKLGRGRVAVFGEAAMFTAQLAGPSQRKVGMNTEEGAENFRLLLNLMRWLTTRDD